MTSRRWQVNTAASYIVALVFKDGLAARLSHDHVVLASRFAAILAHDDEHPAAGLLQIDIEAESLDPDPPGLRARFGLGKDLSASDRRDTKKNMHGRDQLDVKRHPQISLRGSSLQAVDETHHRLEAELSICGVSRSMVFDLQITPPVKSSDDVVVRGSQRLKQSDFGIKAYRGLLGAMKVKDEVDLRWELHLRPAES